MQERLKYLLEALGLSASQFAEKVGIQRSSMSHVLSGRNKPSLDMLIKILEEFPDVDPDWLLLGNGEVYRSERNNQTKNSVDEDQITTISDHHEQENTVESGDTEPTPSSEVEKIVIFYKDKTFRDYDPGM